MDKPEINSLLEYGLTLRNLTSFRHRGVILIIWYTMSRPKVMHSHIRHLKYLELPTKGYILK